MKVLIIYFSATGNTKYGVDLIKHGIEEENDSTCDCIDINKFSKNSVRNYDIIGFACPVFAFKPRSLASKSENHIFYSTSVTV